MPATLDWYDESKSILICNLIGEYDVETIGTLEGQLPMMVREQTHRVYVILHLNPGASLPPLQGILPELGILMNVMPPNFVFFVCVGNGWLLTNPVSVWIASQILSIYYKKNKGRIYVAASVESAVGLIHKLRSSEGV